MSIEGAGQFELLQTPEKKEDFEIEVKIINLGNPELLINKLEAIGAELEIPKRRIRDEYFNLHEGSLPEFIENKEIKLAGITDFVNLDKIFNFLGFNIVNKSPSFWTINRTLPPERRTIRIRMDDKKYVWTVKNPRTKGHSHDERTEINVDINDPKDAQNILSLLGYEPKLISEKDRITYSLNDCLVEINYGPMATPWGEIEGPSKDKIFETAKILGYGNEDLASMSDGDYYKAQGVKKKQLKEMTFDKFQKQ